MNAGRERFRLAPRFVIRGRLLRRPPSRDTASRFELPLLGSNQDSPDPESGVLPVTPRGIASNANHGLRTSSSRSRMLWRAGSGRCGREQSPYGCIDACERQFLSESSGQLEDAGRDGLAGERDAQRMDELSGSDSLRIGQRAQQ